VNRFIPVDRDTAYLLPPSVDEWLPSDHLARFVVEVIEQLDLEELTRQYAGRSSAAHHPGVLLGLLIYGYASGVHSSRKIERATWDLVAFRYVAANTHPDHDTLAMDTETMMIVTAHVSQACNDEGEVEPTLQRIGTLPEQLGQAHTLLADNGYSSAANVIACADEAKIEPLLALKRQTHHMAVLERFAPDGSPPQRADLVQTMAYWLGTRAGRALYGLRKQTVEPVFGIIKGVMGWSRMSMRGLVKAQGEWGLVTMAWNIKRMHVLRAA
jgi:hypothetical protein